MRGSYPAAGSGWSVVARPRLFERLSAGFASGVTLVSASAGSGKTALVRSWIEADHLGDRTAWVSVRREEEDAQRFWLSVVDALRGVRGADDRLAPLTPTPQFDGQAFVERLVGDLADLEHPVLLVIDDLHELRAAPLRLQLTELIEKRPTQLRLVLATRHDPQLGLHRLRLAAQLIELREADLTLTVADTRALLAVAGVQLDENSLSELHRRTEGWAAGLRLASLSLAGHPDPGTFVREFSGSERTVAEYLLAEVLARQPAGVRELLLRTSIVDQVTGPLADHLLRSSGSERILLSLADEHVFVVAVDAARTVFRYHHLLADLLRLELRRWNPDAVRPLHRAAADWYAAEGNVLDAVRHATLAEAWDHASAMLADEGLSLSLDGHGGTVDALLGSFPRPARRQPVLAALIAFRELSAHSLDAADASIALAERNAADVPADQQSRFRLNLAIARLALGRRRGDETAVLAEVRSLLEPSSGALADARVGDDARAVACMSLGIVELWSRHPDEAERNLERGVELARRAGRPYLEIACLSHLALVPTRPLTRQEPVVAEAVALAERNGWDTEPIACMALTTMAAVKLAMGRFEEAGAWLDRADRALREEIEPATALFHHLVRGVQRLAQGQLDEATRAFAAAERRQEALVTTHVLTALARDFLIQTQIRLGHLDAARTTLARVGEEDRGWGESRAATAAIHLADDDPTAAIEVLAPVIDRSARVIQQFTVVQALLLEALARDALGETAAAERAVERALDVTETDAVVFPFVLTPARHLLERHPRHATAHAALLSDLLDVLDGSGGAGTGPATALQEELSHSELRVLRYLPSNLTAPDIAQELFVSTSTVKTHMRHIYEKLGVHGRSQAVDRARDLGLLAATTRRRT